MANFLTLVRILLALPTVVAVISERFELALALTLLGAVSDALDGKLARWGGEVTTLGKFLDPLADKIFVLSVLVALVEVDKVSSLPVVLLLLRELSVSFVRSLAAVQGVVFGASVLGKFKTSLEFLSLCLILWGYPFGVHILWVSVLVAYLSAYEYLRAYLKEISGLNYP